MQNGAPIIDELAAQPDIAGALQPITLDGAMDGESALVARRADGPRSPLFFSLGVWFFAVSSGDGAQTVAEAIIAQDQ